MTKQQAVAEMKYQLSKYILQVLLDENLSWSLDGEGAMGYHRAEITALHEKLHMQV